MKLPFARASYPVLFGAAALSVALMPADAMAVNGKKSYAANCLACHQAQGQGIPGAFPPLRDNPHVQDNKLHIAKTVLSGMSGELEVKGKTYNAMMPAQPHLTDVEIAAIATYILQNFDNGGGQVTPEEVAEVREEVNK
ncbi:cytochrome c [Pseudidiomarina sp.]|uniref:c-type cytochrome n=1 Tax=Pseudidiomarina sp. TaxID=2081707 RepID=UPI00299DC9EB|nr:cytochrome c [Pseudidiomarina sp.]MDX1706377.1 cytochrome c [Pseudidiomarina sp.]